MTASPYRTVIESMFRIVDRRGVAVDFKLNEDQARLDAEWSRRNLVTKIRQHRGVSSYVIARYTAKCLGEENRRCVIVSHESEATSRLLARARYILNNLKGDVKPQLGTDNQRAIVFKKTGSSFWIGTAGSRAFGRGDTITDLHLSEAAFYEHPEKTVDGLFPAAELGEITVESTGNGVGNWFHRQATQARLGRGFKDFFFGWIGVPSCAVPFASDEAKAAFVRSFNPEWEETQLHASGVSLEQLQWRRERLIEYEGDLRRLKENYPATFDECFQSSGYGFFHKVRYEPTPNWQRVSAGLYALRDHPRPGLTYVIGADPSGGVGNNNSVAEVFCLDTKEQVAEYASAWCEPDAFAVELAALSRKYNNAYVTVERNNHGGTTLSRLLDLLPIYLVHRGSHGELSTQEVLSRLSHYGTLVTPANRGIIIGTARTLLKDLFTIHSPELKGELDTFVEKDGKAQADEGCFDDRVMASAHALIVLEQAGIAASISQTEAEKITPRPFGFESVFGDIGEDKRLFTVPSRYH